MTNLPPRLTMPPQKVWIDLDYNNWEAQVTVKKVWNEDFDGSVCQNYEVEIHQVVANFTHPVDFQLTITPLVVAKMANEPKFATQLEEWVVDQFLTQNPDKQ